MDKFASEEGKITYRRREISRVLARSVNTTAPHTTPESHNLDIVVHLAEVIRLFTNPFSL
jgi:hypothetical protein